MNCSIDFPREVLRGESLFTNMVIDATTSSPTSNCDDVFIYITDTVEPGTKPIQMHWDYLIFVFKRRFGSQRLWFTTADVI